MSCHSTVHPACVSMLTVYLTLTVISAEGLTAKDANGMYTTLATTTLHYPLLNTVSACT